MTDFSSVANETFLLKYRYMEDGYHTLAEHIDILNKEKSVLWGIFGDNSFGTEASLKRSNSKRDNFLVSMKEIRYSDSEKYGFLLGKSPEGINIMHRFFFDEVLTIKENEGVFKAKYSQLIPSYYRDNENIYVFLKITRIEQVPLSFLDLYRINEEKTLRESLMGQTPFSLLKKNTVNIPYLEKKIPNSDLEVISKITGLLGIYIKNYYGIKNLFINFSSNRRYSRSEDGNLVEIDNIGYNIFLEDGITNMLCILGKNGVGKSRIIRLIINYISGWQNLNFHKEEGSFELFFSDSNDNRIIKAESTNGYIGKVQSDKSGDCNESVILDFSLLRNIFISNTPADPYLLESNSVINTTDNYSKEFTSYQYFGVMPGKKYSQISSINDLNYILFFILSNTNLATVFNDVLAQVLGYNRFSNVELRVLSKKEINKEIQSAETLFGLLKTIAKSESEDFFKRNRNRNELKKIFSQLQDSISSYFQKLNLNENISILSLDEFYRSSNKNKESKGMNDNSKSKDVFNLLFSANLISLDIFTDSGISLRSLSTGEMSILTTVAKIIFSIYENGGRSLNIFMDEPDVFLHPEWQRRFIFSITSITSHKLIQEYIGTGKLGIIMTTHSPIIVSDIPKENIIALDKDTKNKIVRKDLETQTFLNNLLVNYVNTFSVNAFIGEYSIKKFKDNKNSNHFMNIIGDKYLNYSIRKRNEENK